MRKLLLCFVLYWFFTFNYSLIYCQTFSSFQIQSYSGSDVTIRIFVSANTSFGQGVSGGLSIDNGNTYPYGWGPFEYHSGSSPAIFRRDFTLPANSTNIGGEFKICDFGTNNNCSPSGSNFAGGIIAGPLPIKLTSFDLQIHSSNIKISWSTASETNNDYFEVLHSTTGKDFQVIGMVKGAGSTSETQSYFFVHQNPARGRSFYRLRQVDFDGKYEYSPIRSVFTDSKIKEIQIAPNPVSDLITFVHDGSTSALDISIRDITGRSVAEYKNYNAESLDVSQLPSGLYTITMIADGETTTQKMVKE